MPERRQERTEGDRPSQVLTADARQSHCQSSPPLPWHAQSLLLFLRAPVKPDASPVFLLVSAGGAKDPHSKPAPVVSRSDGVH